MNISIDVLKELFGIVSAINMMILIFWWILYMFFKNHFFKIQTKMFSLSKEELNVINYKNMSKFELWIWFFNIVPFMALMLIGK